MIPPLNNIRHLIKCLNDEHFEPFFKSVYTETLPRPTHLIKYIKLYYVCHMLAEFIDRVTSDFTSNVCCHVTALKSQKHESVLCASTSITLAKFCSCLHKYMCMSLISHDYWITAYASAINRCPVLAPRLTGSSAVVNKQVFWK